VRIDKIEFVRLIDNLDEVVEEEEMEEEEVEEESVSVGVLEKSISAGVLEDPSPPSPLKYQAEVIS